MKTHTSRRTVLRGIAAASAAALVPTLPASNAIGETTPAGKTVVLCKGTDRINYSINPPRLSVGDVFGNGPFSHLIIGTDQKAHRLRDLTFIDHAVFTHPPGSATEGEYVLQSRSWILPNKDRITYALKYTEQARLGVMPRDTFNTIDGPHHVCRHVSRDVLEAITTRINTWHA
jgi:hypothetical protein